MSAENDLRDIAQMAVNGAAQRGIPNTQVTVSKSRSVELTYRNGKPDKVKESTGLSLSISLYDKGKYSTSRSNDMRPAAIEQFLDSAVALTGAMTPDPFRKITDPALYKGRSNKDLCLYDPEIRSIDPDMRAKFAQTAERSALDAAGDRAISAEASFEDTETKIFKLHSNGFEGSTQESQIWLFAEVTLKDKGERRPDGWEIGGTRFCKKLPDPAAVGIGAFTRAAHRIGATRLDTTVLPMIIENRAAGRFLGSLIAATSGRALQQRQSFLADMQEKKVGSNALTMIDNPFVLEGFGSRLFDAEGITAKELPIFEGGVLRNYYVDSYYGKKLKMAPTTGSRSNLVFAPGNQSLDKMISKIDRGVLVRGFIGGNTNAVTGDFSLGVYGTLIENGTLTSALSELNISGNHKKVWKHLVAAGSDSWMFSSLRVPSLMFDEMQFSGG